MLKLIIISSIVVLNFFNSLSYYNPTYLPSLLEKSEIIVHARLISVEKESFKVVVLKNLYSLNNKNFDTLEIKKFNDWTCAYRYSEYKIGQEAIYFLKIDKDKQYQTLGAGNEGELIVKSNQVFISDYNQKIVESMDYHFLIPDKKYIKIDIETTIEGIRIYLDKKELITKELEAKSPNSNVVYQISTIERLPNNIFLKIVLDQKIKGF